MGRAIGLDRRPDGEAMVLRILDFVLSGRMGLGRCNIPRNLVPYTLPWEAWPSGLLQLVDCGMFLPMPTENLLDVDRCYTTGFLVAPSARASLAWGVTTRLSSPTPRWNASCDSRGARVEPSF